MKCPFCTARLEQIISYGTSVDICKACGGVWFDPGELKNCIDFLLNNTDKIPEAYPNLEREVVRVRDLAESKRACPKCSVSMEKFNYSYDSNVILDKCDSCSGIWADMGELYKLAVYMKGNKNVQGIANYLVEHTREIDQLKSVAAMARELSRPAGYAFLYPKLIVPISDSIGIGLFPFVQLGIIILNILIYIIQATVIKDPIHFFESWGFIPVDIFSLHGFLTLFSSGFIHAGFFHLFGNMLFLWIFGDNIEDKFGHLKFFIFYLICLAGANFAHFFANAHSDIPAIGASGAVSGVMGAYFIFHPHAKVKMLVINRVIDIPAVIYIGAWIAMQILMGFVYHAAGISYGISYMAHVGGFATGMLSAWIYKTRHGKQTA